MTDGTTAATSAEVRAARFVYGAVLVGERLSLVECFDEQELSDRALERTRATAFTSIGTQLVPFLREHGEEIDPDVPGTAAPHRSGSVEVPRLSQPQRVGTALGRAGAAYLLINTAGTDWKRIQNTVPEEFETLEPRVGRFLVASALVDDASERLADISAVDPADIDVIDWDSS